MNLSALFIALGIVHAVAYGIPFSNCKSGYWSIKSVNVDPYPVDVGHNVTISAEGTLSKGFTSGKYELEVKVLGITLLKESGNMCDLQGISCPVSAGDVTLSNTFLIPEKVPKGNYRVQLDASDQDGNTLFCEKLKAKVNDEDSEFVHNKEMIDFINNYPETTWIAAPSARWYMSTLDDVATQCGVLEGGDELPMRTFPDTYMSMLKIPDAFDSREEWGSKCPSLYEVRDQGSCGSCWAVAAAAAMTDRQCVLSNGEKNVRLSAEDLVSCCGFTCGMGCNGGYPSGAWRYWSRAGVVSGAVYGNSTLCYSYQIAPCEHHVSGSLPACSGESSTPHCRRKCENGVHWHNDKHVGSKAYSISSNVEHIQAEIMENGPVEAAFTVYADFPNYNSGVYRHLTGRQLGGHAVKIIGWGTESGTDYWLIANSWNSDWGDKGFFKILRGSNECGIESSIVAGTI